MHSGHKRRQEQLICLPLLITLGKRCRSHGHRQLYRADETTDADLGAGHLYQSTSRLLIQSSTPGCNECQYHLVYKGSIGLHQIICEREGVILIVMKESYLRTEPGAYNCSGRDGTEDGVSIVEQLIGKRSLPVTDKVRTKETRPILPSRYSLPIGTISTEYLSGNLLKGTSAESVSTSDQVGLIIDLRDHDSSPQLLDKRLGGLRL